MASRHWYVSSSDSEADAHVGAPALCDLAVERAGAIFAATRARREPSGEFLGVTSDTELDSSSTDLGDPSDEPSDADSLVADWFAEAPPTPGALSAWSGDGVSTSDELSESDSVDSSASEEELAEEAMWDVERDMTCVSVCECDPGKSDDMDAVADAARSAARGRAAWARLGRAAERVLGNRVRRSDPPAAPGRVVRAARRSREFRAAFEAALMRRERRRVAPAIPAAEFVIEVDIAMRSAIAPAWGAWSPPQLTRRALALLRTVAEDETQKNRGLTIA